MRRRPGLRPQALRTALARASLRVRVMAVAAVLVAVTSVLMGLLGTVLLRDYLYGRVDAQLRTFSSFTSRVVTHPRPGPLPRRPGSQQLPTDYLVEVVGPGGQVWCPWRGVVVTFMPLVAGGGEGRGGAVACRPK